MDETPNTDVKQQYPWRGIFMTKTEIDDYFAGNKVECLICGKRFILLPKHLSWAHELTADEYKERYGLPWKRGLCGVGLSKKRSKLLLERLKNGFKPPIEIAMKKSVGAPRINHRGQIYV